MDKNGLYEELGSEGIDLLSRLTTLAFESGYRMSLTVGDLGQISHERLRTPEDCAAGRLLGVTYLLQYLQWGYRQECFLRFQRPCVRKRPTSAACWSLPRKH